MLCCHLYVLLLIASDVEIKWGIAIDTPWGQANVFVEFLFHSMFIVTSNERGEGLLIFVTKYDKGWAGCLWNAMSHS